MANPGGTPQNLRPPWPPGVSGNPNGRPVHVVSVRHRQLLQCRNFPKGKKKTHGDLIAETIIRAALDGDWRFIELLLDRTEGKMMPAQPEPDLSLEAALNDAVNAAYDQVDAKPD
jgi:hypothetical protein